LVLEPETLERMCPRYEAAVQLLGKKWTGMLLRVLLAGPTRFSEFTRQIPDVSARLVAERLKELEEHGIVVRTVHPDRPVTVEYSLTEKGRALAPVVEAIQRWAERWCDVEQDQTES
jgi:Predicted transcriptional regulators